MEYKKEIKEILDYITNTLYLIDKIENTDAILLEPRIYSKNKILCIIYGTMVIFIYEKHVNICILNITEQAINKVIEIEDLECKYEETKNDKQLVVTNLKYSDMDKIKKIIVYSRI